MIRTCRKDTSRYVGVARKCPSDAPYVTVMVTFLDMVAPALSVAVRRAV